MKFERTKELGSRYYSILFFFYTLSLFSNIIRIGIIGAIGMFIISMKLIMKKKIFKSDLLIHLYIGFNIISIAWFPRIKLPISVYITEIVSSIFPICFYFFKNTNEKDELFLKRTMNAIYYSLFIGLFLYVWAPNFYGSFLKYHSFTSNSELGWIRQAPQSFYGVTAVGTFSTIVLLYLFMKIIEENKIEYDIQFILVLIILFLSSRRSAWLAFLVVLVFFHYLLYIKWKKLKFIHFIIELCTLLLVTFVMIFLLRNQFNNLINRVGMMSVAISERSGNWFLGIQSVKNIFIGNGLGSMNHASHKYGNLGVYDSSYIKMYAETGLIGIFLFFTIISRALIIGVKNIKKCYIEFGIISVFLLQAIGSNVLSFQVLAPIFWYSVGQCTKKRRK